MRFFKHWIKLFLARYIRSCLAEQEHSEIDKPNNILFEGVILQRVLSHFEGRKKTWTVRGSNREFDIGHYFEFGCYDGDTLIDFFNALKSFFKGNFPEYWKMFAFDSFEGLPKTYRNEDLHPYAGEGSYKSQGMEYVYRRLSEVGCGDERLQLYKGFFETILTEKLCNDFIEKGIKASFVNIDCDYYSSTMTTLNWIEPLLHDGSIVYFDDIYFYNCNPQKGELKAISDFNSKREHSGLSPAPFFDRGWRCYMYWRNREIKPHKFEFENYISG